MSEETTDKVINSNKKQCKETKDDECKRLINSFNKWGTHRRSTTIGNNISIRFGKTISLGIKYYDKNINKLTKKYGLSFDDFVNRINKLPTNKKQIFFLTFQETMSLKYISEHFVCWNDVKDDKLWKLSAEQYLFKLISKIINAYKNNILKKPSVIKSEQFKNKLSHMHKKYLKQIKSFEKQKKRKLHELKNGINETNKRQTENEYDQNQTDNNSTEPPLKKQKIYPIKLEPLTTPISPTSDTSVSYSTTSTNSAASSNSNTYSNITIPDFNTIPQFNFNLPNFSNMPQFNVGNVNNNSNNSNNYLNISAINNDSNVLEGQKHIKALEHVQQQIQQELTEHTQLPYEPQFLPNINVNDLNSYNNIPNINMNTSSSNDNRQDVITVKYRIRVDWNGISIQQL